MVKIDDNNISAAIKEARRRVAEIKQTQREYDALEAKIGSADIAQRINELGVELDIIDEDIAWHARRKIWALCNMANYINALTAMDEQHEASRIIRRPIPERRPRSEDVVTGKIYPNPAVACSMEGIKYDFRLNPPAGAWLRSKGYTLRDVR